MTDAAGPRRILILDNAISNGGDAAILLAMQESLRTLFGAETEIRVCYCGVTSDPGAYRTLYPEVSFVRALWHADRDAAAGPRERLLRACLAARFTLQARLSRLKLPNLLLRSGEHGVLRAFQEADLIVVSGGGFLNSSWTPPRLRRSRIAQYRTALLLGKPLVFYAQSLGPFDPQDPLPGLLRPILRQADAVLCRDALSAQMARELLGGPCANVRQTMDEALLIQPREPVRAPAPPKARACRIGICVHQWHWQGAVDPQAEQRAFEARIGAVCAALLASGENEIVFLTTHQGVEGVHQDNVVSRRIREKLPPALQPDAHLVEGFVHPREMAFFLGACDLTLSSRMHGALLSLAGGAPTVALAYEPKTVEAMRELGLADWTLSMRDSGADQILACIRALLNDLPEARRRQESALAQGRTLALRNRALLHDALKRRRESGEGG